VSVKSSTGTRYGTPTTKGGPARSTEGRRCESPGCGTILSVYNTATMCYLHTTSSPRHPLAGTR
jgi:hypothetical protein